MRCKPPKKRKQRAFYLFAFSAGVMIATFCPWKALVLMFGIVIVLLGCAYLRCP